MLPDDIRDLLRLHLAEGVGPVRAAALLEYFGSPARAGRATADELRGLDGFGPKLSAATAAALKDADVDGELDLIERNKARVLVRGREGYPERLAELPAAPLLLYHFGALADADARAVALVGTRHPTAAGKYVTRMLAEGLAKKGVCVVSGLALGVDGVAHRAALDAGGRTLAVLGSGLKRLYPKQHRDLANDIVKCGAVLSECRMEQEPTQGLFPARNRIISGLSRVVVVVQAAAKSGALITASHAGEQGVTVMAVPGSVEEEAHDGCHELIRKGAVLCRGVDDILEELDGLRPSMPAFEEEPMREKKKSRRSARADEPSLPLPEPRAETPTEELTEPERRILDSLSAGPLLGDTLAERLGLAVAALAVPLMKLELRRAIRRLPGNRFERT